MRASVLLNLTFSFGLPLVLAFFLIVQDKRRIKALVLGIITFVIFQVFSRIPLFQFVLANQVGFILFSYDHPIAYLFLLSLSAGLFEEVGRYLMMKKWLNKGNFMEVFTFGIGHGGIEAILFVGLGVLFTDVTSVRDLDLIMGGVERVFAMCLHLAFSFLVFTQISRRLKYGLAISILLHTTVNFIAVYMIRLGVELLVVELGLFVKASLAAIYLNYERKHFNER